MKFNDKYLPEELAKVHEKELHEAQNALFNEQISAQREVQNAGLEFVRGEAYANFNGNNVPLTIQQIQALNYEAHKLGLQFNKQQAIKYVDHVYKEETNRNKRVDAEAVLLKKEEIRMKRELISYSVFEDSGGYLYKMIIDADGKSVGCKKICTKRNFHLTMFHSSQCPERKIYLLTWDENPNNDFILLPDEKLNATTLGNMLIRRGIHLQTAKEYRKNLLEEVLTHLLKYKEDVELPFSTGWNLVRGEWTYVRPGEPNMKEMFSCMQKI